MVPEPAYSHPPTLRFISNFDMLSPLSEITLIGTKLKPPCLVHFPLRIISSSEPE